MRTFLRRSGPPSCRWTRASRTWAAWRARPAGAGWPSGFPSPRRGSPRAPRCSWGCRSSGSRGEPTENWTGSRLLRPELRQLGAMALHEFLVDVTIGVVPHLADLVASEPHHDAGALVQHVLRGALEPAPLPDFHDHALLGVGPVAPHVLVAPVGCTQAGLAVPQRIEHPLPTPPLAADRRHPGHPVRDVVVKHLSDRYAITGEQRFLVRFGDIHPPAHTIASSGLARGLALRPARSIGFSIIAWFCSRILPKSRARSTSSRAASRSASLACTCRTLFCMSSASQPRECPMKGNGGNTKPSSDQKGNRPPATAWVLSCPPVVVNAATLVLMRRLLWMVIWFCTQFSRSASL